MADLVTALASRIGLGLLARSDDEGNGIGVGEEGVETAADDRSLGI